MLVVHKYAVVVIITNLKQNLTIPAPAHKTLLDIVCIQIDGNNQTLCYRYEQLLKFGMHINLRLEFKKTGGLPVKDYLKDLQLAKYMTAYESGNYLYSVLARQPGWLQGINGSICTLLKP